jgi:hypothetical protein
LRAWREGNDRDVHRLCDLRPEELNPLRARRTPEPDPFTPTVFLRNWLRAKTIADMLDAAVSVATKPLATKALVIKP